MNLKLSWHILSVTTKLTNYSHYNSITLDVVLCLNFQNIANILYLKILVLVANLVVCCCYHSKIALNQSGPWAADIIRYIDVVIPYESTFWCFDSAWRTDCTWRSVLRVNVSLLNCISIYVNPTLNNEKFNFLKLYRNCEKA